MKINGQTYSRAITCCGYCCSWLHCRELLRQAQDKDGKSGHWLKWKQPAAIEIHHWLHSITTR